MSKASKGGAAMVEVSVTTFDKGDETIRFIAAGDVIKVKELGKASQTIELEAAVAWMTRMSLPGSGWGVAKETQMMPAWAV